MCIASRIQQGFICPPSCRFRGCLHSLLQPTQLPAITAAADFIHSRLHSLLQLPPYTAASIRSRSYLHSLGRRGPWNGSQDAVHAPCSVPHLPLRLPLSGRAQQQNAGAAPTGRTSSSEAPRDHPAGRRRRQRSTHLFTPLPSLSASTLPTAQRSSATAERWRGADSEDFFVTGAS